MTAATVLTILGIVNGLLTVAKDAPTVVEEVKSLLTKVEPYLEAAGDKAKADFADLQAQAQEL